MTNAEFTEVVAYVECACGKLLPVQSKLVYFDMLNDLPADLFRLAAKRVLAEHRWATFPTVAEFRAAAAETARGEVKELTPAEAWALAWWVVGNCDPEIDGSFDRACKRAKAPPLVVEAIRSMSLPDLCYGENPVGVIRGQFLAVFEQLQARDRRKALLPPAVLDQIAARREALAAPKKEPAAVVGRLAESFATPGV